ncbi:NONE-like protein [Thermochaetoides thermophila DSM 1495]|uniref:enoyl-[acyl-carrier-protein] reductase n=1 Tax=Chaetomium thermophilum (strain DSM 1495 / CBS 144.50 / IMI 039719) TaxID=759272 RepID=G0S1D9_CHATD|nr:NONE-like protein [Thermochaetoides thermophila DSM 1495]EGS22849.1 NONE-like protein [Thermochaetoides thermophila DSM 1495]
MASILSPHSALRLGGISTLSRQTLLRTSRVTLTQLPKTAPQLPQRRHKSAPYGYTQSKTLVFPRFGEPIDVLSLHTHSISPTLPDTAVLLRTLAAPINPADVNTIQGTYGAKPTFSNLLGTAEPAAVPGNEGVFEVVSVGSEIAKRGVFKKGDWVIPSSSGFGTFRTHVLVEEAEQKLWRIGGEKGTEGLTPVQVATVSVNPCSAYRMLRDYVDLVGVSVRMYQEGGSDVRGGAWFLQNGANSGVGRAAIQLGRLWGLRSINVVRERATAEETEALKKELYDLGATVVVTESEFLDRSFTQRLNEEWTRGGKEPLLLALNCVGGKSAQQIVRALSPKGTMVTYGGMSRQSFPFPTGPQIFKRLRFEGFWLSEWAKENPAEKKKCVDEIIELMREGKFKEAPVQEIRWDWETEEKVLKEAVQGTLEGFRSGKGVFIFGDT